MKIPRLIFGELAEAILLAGAVRATKYYDDKTVVSAQRKLCAGKIDFRNRMVEILFKIGKPNFKEQQFLKQVKLAGEPLPVKKIQLKFIK